MQLAEKKKEGVRKTIAAIREEFQDLIKKNNSLPENVRLNKKVRFYMCFIGRFIEKY